MTLEEAVAVLNREKHSGFSGSPGNGLWEIADSGEFSNVRWSADFYKYLTPFETIAIAEKYERERNQPDTNDYRRMLCGGVDYPKVGPEGWTAARINKR